MSFHVTGDANAFSREPVSLERCDRAYYLFQFERNPMSLRSAIGRNGSKRQYVNESSKMIRGIVGTRCKSEKNVLQFEIILRYEIEEKQKNNIVILM